MPPHGALTTGALQPALAPQASAPVDAGTVRPQPSATTLANLKAEVLLRLVEAMLRHLPRGQEAGAKRSLLETLLSALKALPGREAENARRLADLLAKLPPEARPSVEKLIGTVLSSLPTRSLAEILRNPNGPEAQKLANLLMKGLAAVGNGENPAGTAEHPHRLPGLTTQQLAAVGRHSAQASQSGLPLAADTRSLQAALKRIFDLDGTKPRPTIGRDGTPSLGAQTAASSGSFADVARKGSPLAERDTRPEARLPAAAGRDGEQASKSITPAEVPAAEAEGLEAQRGEGIARSQAAQPAQGSARAILQAVLREAPPEVVRAVVADMLAHLSEEETQVLRALLEQPLDDASGSEAEPADLPTPQTSEETAAETAEGSSDGASEPQQAEQGPRRGETAVPATPALRETPDQEEIRPIPRATADAAPAAAAADARPELALFVAPVRESVPYAFVPYPTAADEAEQVAPEESEEEQAADEEQDGEATEDGEESTTEDSSQDEATIPQESADMERRREKAAEMVGVMEPGLVFYQKLGDYWT